MKRVRLTITANNKYDDFLMLTKQELLGKVGKVTPAFRAYTNPQGSDISTLNEHITILSETKCNIEKTNLVFVLSQDRNRVSLCLNNFSINNLFGLGAEVTFETTGRYNYQEQFKISFNVSSEFLGLELSNPRIVYQGQRLQPNKAIESFDVKCMQNTSGLLDWQYKTCWYTLHIAEPFYFIDGGRKLNSQRLQSRLGYNTTLNVGLADINDLIVGEELTPTITIEGNGTSSRPKLLGFKLEYCGVEVSNINAIKLDPIIGDTKAFESFDLSFKGRTKNLKQWQYLANECELKLNQPFCFEESRRDSIIVESLCDLFKSLHVCLSSKTDPSYIGQELTPVVTISGKEINEEVELLHPVIIQPEPAPEIEVKFVPELPLSKITDITKDIRIGYLEITNTCNNPLGEYLKIEKIEPSNKCISIEETDYSHINPGKSAKVTVLKYNSQTFMKLTEEPFSINCKIKITSNAGVKELLFTLVVKDDTLVVDQNEITIPITPLPQLNIEVCDQIICYDGEDKKEMNLCVSNWHDKPRKNVSFSLVDKKGVTSLEENSFPEITPNGNHELLLLIDVSKLALNKSTLVEISAIADYTYKVSKSVTIIKTSKEVAKPKIENFNSENNSIIANGQEYQVSTFEIVNDTQSASEIEAESADIASLRIEISEQARTDFSTFFRIDRPKDFLKPKERVKCTVLLKIKHEKFDENYVYINYRPVCDNQTNYEESRNLTQCVTINRQLPVEKSKITFVPEQNNGYDPKDINFLIGTIILHKKRKNPDSGTYYDRTKECIGIVDKDFFFINKDGIEIDDVQTFGIEQKELRLYWRVKDNVFLDMSLPIHYYCENVPEDNDKLISEIYE